jgi:putative restriction endonuclease
MGVGTYQELLTRVRKYRRDDTSVDPVIGCNVLANPFFFAKAQWVPVPQSWAPSIVQGKGYDANQGEGAALWEAVRAAMSSKPVGKENMRSYSEIGGERFGAEYLTRTRLGQGAFRVLVTDAYERRCAVTGEKTLPVLEAAHIKPYALEGPHQVQNGLLLRSDLHKLFDLGLCDGYSCAAARGEFATPRGMAEWVGVLRAPRPGTQLSTRGSCELRAYQARNF